MPLLILPPTYMITENPETAKTSLARAKAYQDSLLQQLGLTQSQEESAITKGAYRGTRVFRWNKNYNAYIATFFMFPNGIKQNEEYMQSASLIRHGDCMQMGSVWNVRDKSVVPFPIDNSTGNILQMVDRIFLDRSPIRINSFYNFRSEDRIQNILDTFLGEKFASSGIPNVTNLARIVCKGTFLSDLKYDKQWEYPARAHRVIIVNMTTNFSQEKETWPKLTYKAQLNSGVFAEKHEDLLAEKSEIFFNPQKISDEIAAKVIPKLHDLKETEFKIIRRYRGWVYLNRGRAFGLQIGMRLVGPNHSTFHVIRYLPEVNGEIDSCIAFIRYEDKQIPVVAGDILKIDQTLFPKTKNSDNNLNK